MISIYKITHLESGKCYIGQAVDIKERWKSHCKKSSTCKKLRNAIQKYGKDAFTFEIFAEVPDEMANDIETLLIEFNNSVENGYNILYEGFSRKGVKHSEEARKKMSDARKGKYTGENNSMYGKTYSEEARKKMSDARRGIPKSEEWKENNRKILTETRNEIFDLYATGEYTQRQLGKLYGVHHTTILAIIKEIKKAP